MDVNFEKQLRNIANGMEYPHTPDIAGPVMTRLRPATRPRFVLNRFAWSLAIIFVLLSSLMLVPSVRAAVIEFIQIGIVRIFPQPAELTPDVQIPSTATPGESSSLLIPFLDQIAGETRLATAEQITEYSILLPAYPADLGQPDYVYVQDADGAMTILVWVDPEQPGHVILSLHFIPEGSWAINKMGPVVIEETEVNGQYAIWAVGPYPLRMRDGDFQIERLIDGHVLIWAHDKVTYRLETDLSLEEALKVAESLKPIP